MAKSQPDFDWQGFAQAAYTAFLDDNDDHPEEMRGKVRLAFRAADIAEEEYELRNKKSN